MEALSRLVPRRRPRIPLLAPLVVLGVLASVLATPGASLRHVAFGTASKPFCLRVTHIPDEAYKEYDVYPADPHRGRPAPRVVLSDRLAYASWYSPDHYASSLLMFPLDCIPNAASMGLPNPLGPFGRGGS
jgi:hypothetical protein